MFLEDFSSTDPYAENDSGINLEDKLKNHINKKDILDKSYLYEFFDKYLNDYLNNDFYLDHDILESLLLENQFLFKIAVDNLNNKNLFKFLSYFNREFLIDFYSKFKYFPFKQDKSIYIYIDNQFGINFLELEKTSTVCDKLLLAMLKNNEIDKIEKFLKDKKIDYNNKLLDIMIEHNQLNILIKFFKDDYQFIYDVFYKNKNEFNKLIMSNNNFLRVLLLHRNINNEMLIYILQNFKIDYETLKDYLETLYSDDYFIDALEAAKNTDDLKELLPETILKQLKQGFIYEDNEESLILKKF